MGDAGPCGAHAVPSGYRWCPYERGHPGLHSFEDPNDGYRCVAADPRHCTLMACRLCIDYE